MDEPALARRVFTDPRYCLAFGFGSGLVPVAPGTAGTVVGVLLYLPLSLLQPPAYATAVSAVFIVGVFLCDRVAGQLNQRDPSGIVLDEIVGIWIALFVLPPGWYWLLAGFLVFRVFDILKPWPVGLLDRRLQGGLGIMVDDVAAGLYTLLLIQAGSLLVGWMS